MVAFSGGQPVIGGYLICNACLSFHQVPGAFSDNPIYQHPGSLFSFLMREVGNTYRPNQENRYFEFAGTVMDIGVAGLTRSNRWDDVAIGIQVVDTAVSYMPDLFRSAKNSAVGGVSLDQAARVFMDMSDIIGATIDPSTGQILLIGKGSTDLPPMTQTT